MTKIIEVPDPRRVMVSIRIAPTELAEIDKRATQARVSRTEYLVRSALGADPVEQRLEAIEGRLTALEAR